MFPQYARITVKIKTIGILIWSLSYAPAMTRFCLKKNDSCGAHRPHWFLAVNSHLQALTTAFANHRGPSESRLSCDASLLHVLQCACVNTGAGTIVVDTIHNCTITPASFSTLWSLKKLYWYISVTRFMLVVHFPELSMIYIRFLLFLSVCVYYLVSILSS